MVVKVGSVFIMMTPVRSIILLILLGAVSACNYSRLKIPEENNDKIYGQISPEEKTTLMNFTYVYSKIIEPKCTNCHGDSGKVNLENYENIVSNLETIKKTVFIEKNMPKKGSLTFEEKRMLWNWIKMGAPKDSARQLPLEPKIPLEPKFASIAQLIFEKKCVSCHSPGNSGKRILMDKDSLMNSPLELVLPGNADESGLVLSVERSDKKRMPPVEDGYSALKDAEKIAIRQWITNGAKD